jgi:hypothetical protein
LAEFRVVGVEGLIGEGVSKDLAFIMELRDC